VPDRVQAVKLVLRPGMADLVVTSDPPGAQILLDGHARGSTPISLAGVPMGRHRIEARRDGHMPADTTLEVGAATGQIHLALRVEPPGVLVIQGDRPAQIYVDGTLVKENVQNSGPQRLRPGTHQVRVILVSGESSDYTVDVRSGERVIYDYSKNSVERRPERGS